MNYSRVVMNAIGYELAPVVVSSEELEERLEAVYEALRMPAGQLEALTGIRERRWWESDFSLSKGAVLAGQKALDASGIHAGELGVLIYAGVNRENFEPATACKVAADLGLRGDVAVYDLSNACLGLLNAMVDIANRIELGQIRAGIAVSCETAREINDIMIDRMIEDPTMDVFTKSLATLTGGSGAVAIVLSDGSFGAPHHHQMVGGVNWAHPEFNDLCRWGLESRNGHGVVPFMSTDAVSVLKNGVVLGEETWRAFTEELGWSGDAVDKVICHQVGNANRDTILKTIGVPRSKDFSTYEFLGNMGTVSLPLTAALAEERNFLHPGDRVAFLGIGSGLNCLMLGFEW